MRFTTLTHLAVLGITLPAAATQAGDDLFANTYRPYARGATSAPMPASAPAAKPVEAATLTEAELAATLPPAPPSAMATAANLNATGRQSRLTWLKGGRGPAVGVEPPPNPRAVTTPAAAVAVAAASAGPAVAPDYVPPTSKRLISRLFRSTEPDVPPGLPRGSAPVVMIPPEALGPAVAPPVLTRINRPAPDPLRPEARATELASTRASDPMTAPPLVAAASRPTYAAPTPARSVERSMLGPARPRTIETGPNGARTIETAQGRGVPAIPFAIARPAETGDADPPLRQVQASPDDLGPARPSFP